MSAYYNEFDPYPAAWLRNLITDSGRVPLVDTAFCRSRRDRLGIAPIPFPAILNYALNALCRFFRALVYGQGPAHDSRRTIRMPSVHLDCAFGSEADLNPATAFLSFVADRLPPAPGFSFAIRGPVGHSADGGICQSTCVSGWRLWSRRIRPHKRGIYAVCLYPLAGSCIERLHRIVESRIGCLFFGADRLFCSGRTLSFSYDSDIKSYGFRL